MPESHPEKIPNGTAQGRNQTDRIRVAFCLDSFSIGGTELNAIRTAEALDPDRVELLVFYLQDRGPLRQRYERLGVPMTHVPIPNLYSPSTFLQAVRFARRFQREKVDVVHSHDIYCNIFFVPMVRMLSRCSVIASRRWGVRASRPELATANRWANRFAHRVLANSGEVATILANKDGVKRDKIAEVSNFLSPEAFETVEDLKRLAQRREWGVPDDVFLIGIVARLAPVKNHGLLLKAMCLLGERFHLALIGDGPCRGELETYVRQEGLEARVHFIGEVRQAGNLHQSFDLSVLCSISEGFPNSLIEAMAAEKPVIATPVGGVLDAVVDGVTGVLVPADDAGKLVQAIQMLESDVSLRRRLAGAGRDAVRSKFGQEIVLGKLMDLYGSLILARKSTTRDSG